MLENKTKQKIILIAARGNAYTMNWKLKFGADLNGVCIIESYDLCK